MRRSSPIVILLNIHPIDRAHSTHTLTLTFTADIECSRRYTVVTPRWNLINLVTQVMINCEARLTLDIRGTWSTIVAVRPQRILHSNNQSLAYCRMSNTLRRVHVQRVMCHHVADPHQIVDGMPVYPDEEHTTMVLANMLCEWTEASHSAKKDMFMRAHPSEESLECCCLVSEPRCRNARTFRETVTVPFNRLRVVKYGHLADVLLEKIGRHRRSNLKFRHNFHECRSILWGVCPASEVITANPIW